ncbi:MAG: protein translocase subunit SecDF [Paludibacteraceae bacterium]|nr:protein translocase subunit SecDF [Paludibacteraceae bacterium]
MQHKGIIRFFAILLAIACLFGLSFNVVTSHYNNKAKEYAQGNLDLESHYLDSIAGQKVFLGYTLKECREHELGLGLDLKGGMNVTLEVQVSDVLRSLANLSENKDRQNFEKAVVAADRLQLDKGGNYVDLFAEAYRQDTIAGKEASLAALFASSAMRELIKAGDSNEKVVDVLKEQVNAAIENSFNVLRTRIDRFGVIQPNIQKLGDEAGRILVELPGVKEPERVRKLLQGTANLEFWETFKLSDIQQDLMRADEEYWAIEQTKENNAAQETEVAQTETENSESETAETLSDEEARIEEMSAQMTETPAAENTNTAAAAAKSIFNYLMPSNDADNCVIGIVSMADTGVVNTFFRSRIVRSIMPRDFVVCMAAKGVDEGNTYVQYIALKSRKGAASMSGDVITDASADIATNSSFAKVNMSMNAEGAILWEKLTEANIGNQVAVVLDGLAYSWPNVQNKISGGRSEITGHFTLDEANDLANTLKSGKMPAPARIIQATIVGPSLGQESIRAGLISFIIAFCLVLLYMILYYGLIPGLIADCALLINVFFLFGILASFGAVLTLPGIAGIVLTLGMAVDANVLIYERIREELRSGKNLRQSVQAGFSNAISAIIDSNVTTMLTGIVLAVFGTGPIRGFAITLIVGIVTSFITAVFITRLLLDDYCKRENAKALPFTTNFTKTWFQNMHYKFIEHRKIGYIISGVLIVCSLIGIFARGFNLGIDFSGGRNYQVRFENTVNPQEIRDLIESRIGETAQVITVGSDNQVRISTKYAVNDRSDTIDTQIEVMLYEALQSKLPEGITFEHFASSNDADDNNKIGIFSSQKVGPTIADDIKTSAIWSVLLALLIIGLYIFIRFRNLSFSLGGLAGIAHDTIIILGVYAIFWGILPFSMEVDQSFIAAILTIIGYSINDTVVIFDRIRENLGLYPKRDRAQVMNDSINTTLSRTFSTSMSTLIVLIAIFLFGGETIRGFVFALLLGVLVGTYSSIFIASPIAYDMLNKRSKQASK